MNTIKSFWMKKQMVMEKELLMVLGIALQNYFLSVNFKIIFYFEENYISLA